MSNISYMLSHNEEHYNKQKKHVQLQCKHCRKIAFKYQDPMQTLEKHRKFQCKHCTDIEHDKKEQRRSWSVSMQTLHQYCSIMVNEPRNPCKHWKIQCPLCLAKRNTFKICVKRMAYLHYDLCLHCRNVVIFIILLGLCKHMKIRYVLHGYFLCQT